jgi:two-component system, sensor histidine kinase
MTKTLRILILEDRPADAELIQCELQEAGLTFTAKVVMTESDFLCELQDFPPDLILSDYNLPQYDGALALAEAKRQCPGVPFILVTGAISEDLTIETLTNGAKDYVMKSRLNRLVPAVQRALAEAEEHRARNKAEEKLRKTHKNLEAKVKKRTKALQAEITERKQVEEELHRSEQHFRLLHETMLQGVVYQDAEGKIISMNPAAVQILGKSPEECLDHTSESLEHNTFRDDGSLFPGLEHPSMVALRTGQELRDVVMGVYNPYEKDYCWINVRAMPLFRPGEDKPYQVYIIFDDITERRRIEKTLQDSEVRYRRLFEAAQDGILILDAETGQIVDVNPFLMDMLNYSKEELVGKKLWEIGAFKDIEKSKIAFAELQNNQYIRYENLQLETKDGRLIDVEFVSNVYLVDHTKVIQCNIRDITERKRIEETQSFLLQCGYADEDFFTSLAQYLARSLSMDYVCIDRLLGDRLTAQTVAVYFDGKFEDNVEYTLKDTPCGDVVGKTICCFPRDVRHLFPRDVVLQEMVAESYVGTTLWSSKGQPIGLIAVLSRKRLVNPCLAESIMRLVAVRAAGELERRQAEMELQERTRQLEEANKDLESFSYSISHDLMAPLRAIDGFSRKFVRKYGDKLDEDAARLINVIRSNTERMGALIDDLLSFSKMISNSMNISEIDMDKLANEVWDDVRTANQEREFEVKITKILPGFGDRALIRQVLFNLFSNAVKFTKNRKPGIVEMSSCRESDKVVYCLKDNGAGFDMAYYNKLFGVFQRLHSQEEYEGTGVGLAIVQRIIYRHGGRVWAEGKENEGATFYFTLPPERILR